MSARTRPILVDIADYVATSPSKASSFQTARYCPHGYARLRLLALHYPACTKLLGPIVPGMTVRRSPRTGTRFD